MTISTFHVITEGLHKNFNNMMLDLHREYTKFIRHNFNMAEQRITAKHLSAEQTNAEITKLNDFFQPHFTRALEAFETQPDIISCRQLFDNGIASMREQFPLEMKHTVRDIPFDAFLKIWQQAKLFAETLKSQNIKIRFEIFCEEALILIEKSQKKAMRRPFSINAIADGTGLRDALFEPPQLARQRVSFGAAVVVADEMKVEEAGTATPVASQNAAPVQPPMEVEDENESGDESGNDYEPGSDNDSNNSELQRVIAVSMRPG